MVNQLPQGWKEEELGKLADVSSGDSAPQSSSYFLNGIYPFCRTSDVGKIHRSSNFSEIEDYVNETAISKLHLFRRGTILFPKSGASTLLNHRVMLSIDSYVSSHLATICANSIDRYYLYYFLCTVDAKQLVPNLDYPSLKISELKNIKVPYPTDKDEQEYIVKTLDAVAEMIKLRKETIDLTKKLIPAIFQEMFGDPITNPKGWEILSLDNIITQINNGYNPPKKDFGTGIPFVTVNNLYNGLSIDYDSLDKVMVSNKQIQKYKLNYGDICFVRSSVKREGIGQASAYLSNQDAIFGGFVIRVTPKEIFNPIFLSEYFQTEAMRNIIINKSVTGVMTNINQPALLSIPVLNVPFSMQKEFADNVKQINQNLEVQQKDLDRLQELFDQLLQKAFTGELTRGEDYGKH